MRRQHAWAAGAGYDRITTNTFNRFLPMLLLNLSEGFDVIGTSVQGSHPGPKLHLSKKLV